MNIEDGSTAFFALSAHWCGDTARIVLVVESKGNKEWVSLARSTAKGDRRKNTTPSSFISSRNRASKNRKTFISDWVNLLRTKTQSQRVHGNCSTRDF
ncbi:hypothetical protein QUA44_03045 [Microcoleus sp. N9_A2]|uniref:hypothetical protein n=1 Tax=Microcoleus sp. N9_B2 TaxID=3055385 RepID=UPI002FD33D9A